MSYIPERKPSSFRGEDPRALKPHELQALREIDQNAQERAGRLNKFQRNLKDENLKPLEKPNLTPAEEDAHYGNLLAKLKSTMPSLEPARAEDLEQYKAQVKQDLEESEKRPRSDSYQTSRVVPQTNSGDGENLSDLFGQADKENSDPSNHQDRRQKIDSDDDVYSQSPYADSSKVFEAKAKKYSEVGAYEQSDYEKLEAVDRVNRRLNGQEIRDLRPNDGQRGRFEKILLETAVISKISDAREVPKQAKDLLEYMKKEKSGGIITDDEHVKAKQDYIELRDILKVKRNFAQMAQVRLEMEQERLSDQEEGRKRKRVDEERPNRVDNKGQRVNKGGGSDDVGNEPFDEVAREQQERTSSVNRILEEALETPEKKRRKT